MLNGGTDSAAHDPDVGFDIAGWSSVLEAINAIEVVEAREVIEHAIVRLAAQRRSEADVARLLSLVDGMQHHRDDAASFADHDVALHLALCQASRNTLLVGGLSSLRGRMKELIAWSATRAIAEGRLSALIDSRVQLVDAIGRRDVERAAGVFADMMHDLRVESGRSCPGTTDDATTHCMPWVGMLDDRPHTKGDRP